MFTGIIQYQANVDAVAKKAGLHTITLRFPIEALPHLNTGASIAIDGACLTVVSITDHRVTFDVMAETLSRTTLGNLKPDMIVNIERSLKIGDELGGHILSGHIHTTATVCNIQTTPNNTCMHFQIPALWNKYIFPKGYIAISGISLTIGEIDYERSEFTVYLIPETLKRTTLGTMKLQDLVNIEIETQTLTIVDTVERVMGNSNPLRRRGRAPGRGISL